MSFDERLCKMLGKAIKIDLVLLIVSYIKMDLRDMSKTSEITAKDIHIRTNKKDSKNALSKRGRHLKTGDGQYVIWRRC